MTFSDPPSRPERRKRREDLLAAIAREEMRLDRLEAEQAEARASVAALRTKLASLERAPESRADLPLHPSSRVPQTPSEKIRLFRSFFRGRTDVFPTRFVSRKTGKAGYAPACRNKFVPGLCELPKIKCGECANQAFFQFDDAAILGHLTGRHVMGVYPLLEDETCWFLAVDFDKSTWREDATAFVETCRSADVPAAIERSRSGNGAHVWVFFAAPVPAGAARKMGCHLITETMSRRHQMEMDSYDRLFPSQDTLPRGGFGNLIALPLQYEARREGNTVFLDAQLRPYPDDQQWAYLASVPRLEPRAVARIADEATRAGSVLGLRLAEGTDEERAAPWNRRPSGLPHRVIRVTEPLPRQVHAVLAQKLFVEKAGLPSSLIDQIKRLAAFQNPEFYKRQSMRLSTAVTPRVIACAEDLPEHVGLPRGCRNELESLLREHGAASRRRRTPVASDRPSAAIHPATSWERAGQLPAVRRIHHPAQRASWPPWCLSVISFGVIRLRAGCTRARRTSWRALGSEDSARSRPLPRAPARLTPHPPRLSLRGRPPASGPVRPGLRVG